MVTSESAKINKQNFFTNLLAHCFSCFLVPSFASPYILRNLLLDIVQWDNLP
jgi:hypothetical protein